MHAESPGGQRGVSPALGPPEPEDTPSHCRGVLVPSGDCFSHNCGLGRAVDCHIKSKEFSILIQAFLWP